MEETENYIKVHSFLREDLHLSDMMVRVFSVILTFWIRGTNISGQSYLARICGVSSREIKQIMKCLIGIQLVQKLEILPNGMTTYGLSISNDCATTTEVKERLVHQIHQCTAYTGAQNSPDRCIRCTFGGARRAPQITDIKKNKNNTVCLCANRQEQTAHTDVNFFLHIFFFRNMEDPYTECQRFIDYYSSTNWKLPKGDVLDTDEKRIAKARNWRPLSSNKRFGAKFLASWEQLYLKAPDDIKPLFLCKNVSSKVDNKGCHIKCSIALYDWLYLPEIRPTAQKIFQMWTGSSGLKVIIHKTSE